MSGLLSTPSTISAGIGDTKVYVDSVDRDYQAASAAGSITDAQLADWTEWKANFDAWLASSPSSWFGSSLDQAQAFQRDAQTYEAKLPVASQGTAGPPAVTPNLDTAAAAAANAVATATKPLATGLGLGLGSVALVALLLFVFLERRK